MVLGKLPVPGRPTKLDNTVQAVLSKDLRDNLNVLA